MKSLKINNFNKWRKQGQSKQNKVKKKVFYIDVEKNLAYTQQTRPALRDLAYTKQVYCCLFVHCVWFGLPCRKQWDKDSVSKLQDH